MVDKRQSEESRRQVDRIEQSLDKILKLMDGEGGELGVTAKVALMWGYRKVFAGLIVTNAVAILMFVTKILNGG